MASVQTRVNGNGTAVRPAQAEKEGAKENIFLFIPNLIGMRVLFTLRRPD
jgi:CDP-diacylglycerol--inositol 3-phosphatidyltransferase